MFEFIVTSGILLSGVGLGYWYGYGKCKNNIDFVSITDNIIECLVQDGYIVQSTNDEGEVVLHKIHPKYLEMVKLWERTLDEENERINLAYEKNT